MDNVIDFINVNRDRYLTELKALLAIPSISALPQHAPDIKRCADWCADEMRRIGLQNVKLIETPGNPVVYGDWPYADYSAYPYYWGYPGFIAAGVIATGIAFGAGYGLGRWASGGYWGGGRVNWGAGAINVNRGGRVEHWQHNPAHRQGEQEFPSSDDRARAT